MKAGVVIPVGPGRVENLSLCLGYLAAQTVQPEMIVLVFDGPDAAVTVEGDTYGLNIATAVREKHEPGMEQPRNVGAKILDQTGEFDHVWFVDTDVILTRDAHEAYIDAYLSDPTPRVLVGPYEWMPPGTRQPMPELHNDPRTARFAEAFPHDIYRSDLSAGLACFSGNLMWPLELFKTTGGYWSEIHHGRCEDGELGLRAVAMGIPISFVRDARGWHLYHPIDIDRVNRLNARDVPMLNERHPWKELGEGGQELFVVEEDGKRFNWRCPNCGSEMNSAGIWDHQAQGCNAD